MDKLRNAAVLALESLELLSKWMDIRGMVTVDNELEAITALREALAQPQDHSEQHLNMVQGEPVAWMYKFKTEDPILCKVKRDWADNHSQWKETPLYTTPPSVEAAIEATKEKAAKVCEELQDREVDDAFDSGYNFGVSKCAAAIRSMK